MPKNEQKKYKSLPVHSDTHHEIKKLALNAGLTMVDFLQVVVDQYKENQAVAKR